MSRKDPTSAPIPDSLEGIRQYLATLRSDYDSHDHNSSNSKGFRTLRADTISVRTVSIRKTTFDDATGGFYVGLVGDTVKLNLGNATNYLQWDGTSLGISGTITGSTIIGGTIETSASGQRIVMSGADNKIYFFDSAALVVTLGTTSNFALTFALNATTNNAIAVTSSVAGTGFDFTNNGAVNSRAITISQTSGSNALPSIAVIYGGSSEAILITNQSAASGTGMFINVTNTGASYGLLIQSLGIDPAIFVTSSNSYSLYVSGQQYINYGGLNKSLEINASASTGAEALKITSNNGGASNDSVFFSKSSGGSPVLGIEQTSASATATGIRFNIGGGTSNAYAFSFNGSEVVSSGVGGSQNKKVKVNVSGTDYFIPLNTA